MARFAVYTRKTQDLQDLFPKHIIDILKTQCCTVEIVKLKISVDSKIEVRILDDSQIEERTGTSKINFNNYKNKSWSEKEFQSNEDTLRQMYPDSSVQNTRLNGDIKSKETYQCKYCEKNYKSNSYYRTHLRKKHNAFKHECKFCSRSFLTENSLLVHSKIHWPSLKRNKRCSLCRTYFSSWYTLDRHLLSHSKEKKFNCNICFKSFKYSNHFYQHLKNCYKVQDHLSSNQENPDEIR